MGSLQINILGTSFTINAKEDSEYLKKLLDYYKTIVEQVENTAATKDSMQTAILSGIMLCDELYKEKKRLINIKNKIDNSSINEVEKITMNIINKIDQIL